MIGERMLIGWAKTQTLVAPSSGESDLYATLRVAFEGLGVQAIAEDLGIDLRGEDGGDASAALGIKKGVAYGSPVTLTRPSHGYN